MAPKKAPETDPKMIELLEKMVEQLDSTATSEANGKVIELLEKILEKTTKSAAFLEKLDEILKAVTLVDASIAAGFAQEHKDINLISGQIEDYRQIEEAQKLAAEQKKKEEEAQIQRAKEEKELREKEEFEREWKERRAKKEVVSKSSSVGETSAESVEGEISAKRKRLSAEDLALLKSVLGKES